MDSHSASHLERFHRHSERICEDLITLFNLDI